MFNSVKLFIVVNTFTVSSKFEKLLFLISNFDKHVKNDISNGSFDNKLLLKSNSVTSGQCKNKEINSSEVSVKFLFIIYYLLIIILLYILLPIHIYI